MLELKMSRDADKFLSRIPEKHARQISQKIQSLREFPVAHDSKMLKGTSFLRADSGEYRIIYKFTDEFLFVPIIGKRNDDEVYKQLTRH